jgi:DNA-binding transcriptional ArsR family regulator
MVVGSQEHTDAIFHALSDATRRDIAMVVMDQEHSVSSLARRYPMSVTAVQKHVAVLERAGLVSKHRHGREQLVRGRIDAVRDALAMLERLEAVWRARLGRFDDVLTEITRPEITRPEITRPEITHEGDPT